MSDETKWTLLVGGATIAAGFAARKLLERGWASLVGPVPKDDPELRDTGWVSAVGWSLAAAGVAGAARLAARRGAAALWTGVKSQHPPVDR